MNSKVIFSGAFILLVGNLLSSVLGLSREVISAAYYGADMQMDSYLFANTVPSILLSFIDGILMAGFIPLFIKKKVNHSAEEASLMLSNMVNWLIVAVLAIMAVCYAFSHVLSGFFAINEIAHGQIEHLLWILLPGVLFFSVSYVQTSVLNSMNHFATPAFLTVMNNVVIILFMVIFHRWLGIDSMAWGFVIGTILQVAVQWPVMRKLGVKYRPYMRWKDEDMRKLLAMSLPIVGLVVITQCVMFATRYFSAYLDPGSASSLNYASRFIMLPVTLFGTALVSASYPAATQMLAEQKMKDFNAIVMNCIKSLALILTPIMLICILFSQNIIRILLERGAFDARATHMTATAFMILSAGIVIIPMRDFFNKIFFSKENMRIPILTSTLYLAVFIVSCLVLVPGMRYTGIATASTVASLSSFLFLLYHYRKLDSGIRSGVSSLYFAKIGISSSVGAGAGYGFYYVCSRSMENHQMMDFVLVILSICLSLALYLALIKLFKIQEIDYVYEKLASRFKLRKSGAAVVGKS
ncbi:murein biosynthesis integral membrane protein MurJ [Cohnella lupini]|uniref:Murein biosynthesis integral membrane protein MurJ n=1 Tax=Cohnella lupini TaxID=1294267 RepID=A0A3D9ITJ6_9BACL|nr:murein biosynthesis integral membrane protein MurJ [Cohnella lupini]RED65072.1 murein biosynthesis integral membrane protein MurJ [Cohnella lupini]